MFLAVILIIFGIVNLSVKDALNKIFGFLFLIAGFFVLAVWHSMR